eukprot:CAMPEP_0174920326 /NCGR_PEP_ID=MMETSP1355-20121228/4327_1 /TAXON_ID=464990 /ORGANISM="Hemiselmis tepida, Strain CCMP443" /LENGTH=109 /DNA_ID=CAMNT_0016165663 /DNA_START=14 /DNA_END=340 /DNA_ORIENTATION=+
MEEKGTLRGHWDNPECTCRYYKNDYNIWQVDFKAECPAKGHSAGVNSLAFSPDSKFVASGSGFRVTAAFQSDNSVRIWEVATGREVCSLKGHSGVVFSVAFSPDSKTLA